MTLRVRCREFCEGTQFDVDDLVALVLSEIGRAADERLDDSVPLCLYFKNKEEREEFVAAIIDLKPRMISKRWPR
jgi:hypothetical protein